MSHFILLVVAEPTPVGVSTSFHICEFHWVDQPSQDYHIVAIN